jgi:integrase
MTSSNFSPQNDPWEQLRHCCAPELFCVPKTWSDPFRSPDAEMPRSIQPAIIYMQNNLVEKPWCNTLALLVLVLAAHNVQSGTIQSRLSVLHTGLEKIFSALDLHAMADWNVDIHMMPYLTAQIVKTDTQAQRSAFWKQYRTSSRLMKRWLKGLPVEQQARYTPFVLPYPIDDQELINASKYREVMREQQEKRKEDADAIMPFYAELRMYGRFRYNLLVRIWKAYRQAISLVEKGQAKLPITFTLIEGGNEPTSTDRLVFTLWDRQTLALKYLKTFSPRVQKRIQQKQGSHSDEKNAYLLELVRAETLNENTAPTQLWFLELIEQEVLGDISNGSPKKAEKRRAWLKAHGYEDQERHGPFDTETPGILIPPLTSGHGRFTAIFREKVGMTFLPIESLYVAATFGVVALCILTANGMRVGELLQIRASADGIVPIVLTPDPSAEDQTPIVHWAVQAVPKGHRTPKTYYLDDEHLRFLSLLKLMLCNQYTIDSQTGSELPKVLLRGGNHHRFAPIPDQYLFQYSGQGLYENDIRACLRFLLHGLVFQTLDGRQVTVYPHLLRHGFATWALNIAKEPVDIVAAILNQKNVKVTGYYGRPNPRLIAERSRGLMRHISSYIDVTEIVLRGPEELRTLLQKAKQTHGTLNRTRGGRCLLCGECWLFFSCIGCSAKVPDPSQRGEVEEAKQITLIQIEKARKKGLTLDVLQHEKKLRQCEAELHEMDMIEACRADELREPEVDFDAEA